MNYICGTNLANLSDAIFAQTLPGEIEQHKFVVNWDVEINSGDVVFCKTDNIYQLFHLLSGRPHLKDIKVITNESDHPITESMFNSRPSNIVKWYGVNVEYDHPNLIPIPLGIANSYCVITLKLHHLEKKNHNPSKLLYVNHRVKTNPTERSWIYEYFKEDNNTTIRYGNLSLEDYKNDLDNHKFMLCPKGNGIDTHRLWECVYHRGIIPIIEDHISYRPCRKFPILIVNSFRDINVSFLEEEYEKIKNKNFNEELLNVEYWIDKIKKGESF